MEKKEKIRSSNIELLRVFSMVLIILHHYALHGGLLDNGSFMLNKTIGLIILIGGKIGVNLFVLITGYFLIESKFKIKKLFKLIVQVLFYTIICFIINITVNGNIEFKDLTKSIFPITFGAYWFITSYIGIYVLSPFINKVIKSLHKDKLQIFIFILIIMFSVIGFVSSNSGYMGNLQWLLLIYIIGAYIRLYNFDIINEKKIKIGGIGLYLSLIIGACFSIVLSQYNEVFLKVYRKVININSIIVLIESVLLFLIFKNTAIKNNVVINFLGKHSLGVYLLHDNFALKEIMWKDILKVESFYDANIYYLLIHIITCTIIIYMIGVVIETIRVKCIEEPIFKIKYLENWFNKIDLKINID